MNFIRNPKTIPIPNQCIFVFRQQNLMFNPGITSTFKLLHKIKLSNLE